MSHINNTTDFNITDDIKTNERNLVAGLYLALSIFGLLLEWFVLFIIVKQKQHRTSEFYKLLISVMITEIVAFTLYAFYSSPCVLTGAQIYGKFFGQILSNLETVDFLALVSVTFVIALNRAMSISGSSKYQNVFSNRMCFVYSIGSWVLGFVTVLIDFALQCRTEFLERSYYFAEQCDNGEPALTATSLTIYTSVIGMIILYGYSIWKMWQRYKQVGVVDHHVNDNMHKRKRLLFYQALCITATLFINMLSKWTRNRITN